MAKIRESNGEPAGVTARQITDEEYERAVEAETTCPRCGCDQDYSPGCDCDCHPVS